MSEKPTCNKWTVRAATPLIYISWSVCRFNLTPPLLGNAPRPGAQAGRNFRQLMTIVIGMVGPLVEVVL